MMKALWIFGAACAVAVTMAAPASAAPMWDTEQAAQSTCPKEKVVWLLLGEQRYVAKGQDSYGQGGGAFACESAARSDGYRPTK